MLTWRLKRAYDVVVAGLGLLVGAPLFAAVALAVRLELGPGVLFRQVRVGAGGRTFWLLKFRSLPETLPRPDQESAVTREGLGPDGTVHQALLAGRAAPAVERLRGDMSLVGPRPERPEYVERFCRPMPWYRHRHRMPSGITGLAAVNGLRGDTSIEDRARFDNGYIDNWSLWLDAKIMVRTVWSVLTGAGDLSWEGTAPPATSTCTGSSGSGCSTRLQATSAGDPPAGAAARRPGPGPGPHRPLRRSGHLGAADLRRRGPDRLQQRRLLRAPRPHGVPGRALVPMAEIGTRPQIVCERGLPAVPHLLALVNLTALAKGVLPLHASAFCVGDRGVLVTGWAKSGKTESLLAGVGDGIRYVADEWVYLTPDGRMCGVPEPIRLWAWHLDQLPTVLRARSRADRLRLSGWRAAAALARTGARGRLPGADVLRRGSPLLERQAYLQVPPAELFGEDAMVPTARLDSVVLLLSHEADEIIVSPAGPREVSGRMAASLADERAPFLEDYRQFRYAFPELASPVVETAAEREARLLGALFDDRPAARVAHPYPCDLAELGAAVRRAALEASVPRPDRNEVPAR